MPTYRDHPGTPASDIAGVDLAGMSIDVRILGTGRWTLLVFLSSGCQGCAAFWEAMSDPAAAGLVTDEVVYAVTHDPAHDDPLSVGRLLPEGVLGGGDRGLVVMSSAAWLAYRVQGPPFFVLVDGSADRVVTEGVAWGVDQVADHLRAARAAA